MNTKVNVLKLAESLIQQSIQELGLPQTAIPVTWTDNHDHGDLASPVVMSIFSQLSAEQKKTYQQPRNLAQELVAKIANNDVFNQPTVAGAGYINFTLSDKFLLKFLQQVVSTKELMWDKPLANQKIIVEYTDPNPFKVLHVGHLYSNIVGESLARMYEELGAEVKRACYQGDVGMHIAKSIWGWLQLAEQEDVTIEKLASQTLDERVAFLGKAYAYGANNYKEDQPDDAAVLEMKQINAQVFMAGQQRLQSNGIETVVDYQTLVPQQPKYSQVQISEFYLLGREWSLDYFEKIYRRLGTKFDEYFFESETAEAGVQVVKKYLQEGIFTHSQDAIIFPGEQYGLHNRVFINSLGLPTYEAKELGLPAAKYVLFPYDLSVVVTGNEVDGYFQVVLKALSLIDPKLAAKTKHVSHGMVRLPEGKMGSRTGSVIGGEQLLDAAHEQVLVRLQQNNTISTTDLSDTAESIGQAAVKMTFLKTTLGKNVIFNAEAATALVGDTGPYVQYSAVRAGNVLNKAGWEITTKRDINKYIDTLINTNTAYDLQLEKNILRYIYQYCDIVKSASQQRMPHVLCHYLFELANAFNSYYDQAPILTAPEQIRELRLATTMVVWQTLHAGLGLLGIKTVAKM